MHKLTSFRILVGTTLFFLALSAPAIAAEVPDAPPPPPLNEQATQQQQKEPQPGSEELTEPEVTIIRREDRTIEEYRVNGQLRYAKITPSHGPAYYMIDTDGDGVLDRRDNNIDNPPINQWILLRW